MTDVFKDLPRAQWRGITLPLLSRQVHFDHELIKHKLQFKDLEIVDALGLHNWIFEYTIPFRQDIAKGPYDNLFNEFYPKFVLACRDRTIGDLLDPILGTYRARCISFSEASDPNKRDGVDVNVAFIQSPDELGLEDATIPPLDISNHDGDRIDDQIARLLPSQLAAVGYFTVQNPASPGDLFDSIAGFGQQIAAVGNRVNAQIAKYEHKLNNISRAMDAINKHTGTPGTMPIIRSLNRLQESTRKVLTQGAFPGKQLATYGVPSDTTVGALAAHLKMPLAFFMLTNPEVPKPLVPAGTLVKYFTDER